MQTKKSRNSFNNVVFLVLLAMINLLVSCSSQDKKLNQYIRDLKISVTQKYSKKPVIPLEIKVPVVSGFMAHKGRSPFSPEVTELNKMASPLQIYPISMLKFVGIVMENGKVLAYVVAPDTKLYPVHVGDKIGIHNGIVKSITNDRMVISEQSSDITNKGATQIVTLQLKEEY